MKIPPLVLFPYAQSRQEMFLRIVPTVYSVAPVFLNSFLRFICLEFATSPAIPAPVTKMTVIVNNSFFPIQKPFLLCFLFIGIIADKILQYSP